MSDISEIVSIKDFKRLDLRVGTIVNAEKISGSDKLLKIQVDMGDHKRQIISGIAEIYSLEELTDKNIVVLCNLKPAKIFGNESNGMLLAAEAGSDVSLLIVDKKINNGAKVT
ncbi:methionine--tRNA ligase subunit beta [Candidatus Bathyarchaeota archaeon]|nr:methionine--tRNA ligase subunit beta [Candidatus Bathyarchaeota archaeon]